MIDVLKDGSKSPRNPLRERQNAWHGDSLPRGRIDKFNCRRRSTKMVKEHLEPNLERILTRREVDQPGCVLVFMSSMVEATGLVFPVGE